MVYAVFSSKDAYLYPDTENYIRLKSERQKKIEKHANVLKREKIRRRIALTISAIVITIPIFLKYKYGG